MDEETRRRQITYFERLGEQRVRLYSAVNCDRFLGDWQVRELADEWLTGKLLERQASASRWDQTVRRLCFWKPRAGTS